MELRSGSSGQEYELAEEVGFRPSVHRGLELLDAVDGALDRAGVVRQGEAGDHGVQIAAQPGGSGCAPGSTPDRTAGNATPAPVDARRSPPCRRPGRCGRSPQATDAEAEPGNSTHEPPTQSTTPSPSDRPVGISRGRDGPSPLRVRAAPRTDPSERDYRTGLLPWVCGGEADLRVRVHHAGEG